MQQQQRKTSHTNQKGPQKAPPFHQELSAVVQDLLTTHAELSGSAMKRSCTHLHLGIDLLGKAMTALQEAAREEKKSEEK